MNTDMRHTIRRLTTIFMLVFLILSAVAAYVQVGNLSPFGGPILAGGNYETLERQCPPVDTPLRGRILDRNGNVIAQTVQDTDKSGHYTCGYHRVYAQWVVDTGLAPLIGYYSYRYGSAGLEATYNNCLFNYTGCPIIAPVNSIKGKLLHSPQYGNDVYLTIDMNTQKYAASVYESSAIHSNDPQSSCQHVNNPPGSIVVEDPNTGQILAMVSNPSYDPNKIILADSTDPATRKAGQDYWSQINNDKNRPLINRPTQGLYNPGSTFKTLSLIAGLDSGQYADDTPFTFDEATSYTVPQGETIKWEDYFNGTWNGILNQNSFPLTFAQGYAYSDNAMFARAASQTGKDTWLNYVRKFGISTPGTTVPSVPFDGIYAQSSAYNAITNGKPTDFNGDLLAESGFGQGQLLISPLTMAEITSTVAANGYLYQPHVGWKIVPHDQSVKNYQPFQDSVAFNGGQIIQPATAEAVRQAMWDVTSFGTAFYSHHPGTGVRLVDTGTNIGGKTGTGQVDNGDPNAWFISLAPDDQAPGGAGAKYVVVVNKEHGNEGACQVFVANDIDLYLANHQVHS